MNIEEICGSLNKLCEKDTSQFTPEVMNFLGSSCYVEVVPVKKYESKKNELIKSRLAIEIKMKSNLGSQSKYEDLKNRLASIKKLWFYTIIYSKKSQVERDEKLEGLDAVLSVKKKQLDFHKLEMKFLLEKIKELNSYFPTKFGYVKITKKGMDFLKANCCLNCEENYKKPAQRSDSGEWWNYLDEI